MEPIQPFLEIYSLDGHYTTFALTQDRVTIGRAGYQNDIPLGPDPDQLISRCHCYLERKQSGWWLIENGKNATALRQNGELREVLGQELLSDGSVFCILGYVSESGERRHWQITLHDPEETQSDPAPPVASVSLKYDRARGTLFLLRGKQSEEISLTPHEFKIIDYMIERNGHARNAPVVCTNEELLMAAYGRSFSSLEERLAHPKDSLRHLIEGLRRKLEVNPQEPKFLVSHRRQGYILYTYPSSR